MRGERSTLIKKCVVCGKEFNSPPSAKTVTCSKECSRINKSYTHMGKSNNWPEESKEKLRHKGRTANLEKGTEANTKIWKLTSPEGRIHICKNLALWCRNNSILFGFDSSEENAKKVMTGLRHAKRGAEGKKTALTRTYKGWQAEAATEKEYNVYQYKTADMSVLTPEQRISLTDYLNGIPVKDIANKYGVKTATIYKKIREAKKIIDTGTAYSDQERLQRKEYSHTYYLKHKDRIIAQSKLYQAKHPDRAKRAREKFYKNHREELINDMKKYNKEYYQKNRDHILRNNSKRCK